MAARLGRALAATQGKLHDAVRALVWRLAVHPAQEAGRLVYTELSVGYVAAAAGVGRETARQAWHLLRECVGWFSVPLAQARSMGVAVRRLPQGGRWGQHLLLTPAARQAALQATQGHSLGPVHQALPDGPGWRDLHPAQHGRHLLARCPWHDDRDPSLLLNRNEDGCSGSGVCLGCGLRVYWRAHGGQHRARPARATGALSQGSGTIQNHRPAQGPGRHLLGTLRGRGMGRRASKLPDLLAVLAHAERRSLASGAEWQAVLDDRTGDGPPQLYVSTDPQAPVRWRTLATRRGQVRVPDRWEPVEARWVLADLDGFDSAPGTDDTLATAALALERWAANHPGLTGRLAVVRTSHLGVQVVAEMSHPHADPRSWWRTREARTLAAALDTAALTAVRAAGFQGGHADQAVHAAGRMMRRPGWRRDKRGVLCRARLVYASPAHHGGR